MKKLLLVLFIVGCTKNTNITTPEPSPTPNTDPIEYKVTAIATQGGAFNSTPDVNAGETFKTSITGVECFQSGSQVKCPVFGHYLWRLQTLGLGLCSDGGSVDSAVDSWICSEPTFPASVEIEGCVLDFSRTELGCASVKVRIH